MLLPSALLVIACLLVGVLPARMVGPPLATAMHAILGDDVPAYALAVWHGLTRPLMMSFIALGGGITLYLLLYRRGGAMARTPVISRLNAERTFDVLNVWVIRGAGRLTRRLFSWRLQAQLFLIVGAGLLAGFLALQRLGWSRGPLPLTAPDPVFALLWALAAACAIGAATQAKFHRLAALIMVGGVGLVTALTFAWLSAPDLALTQIAVEVVTLVLILLGLRWLPRRLEFDDARRSTLRARARRARDLIVALAAGIGAAALTVAVLTRPAGSRLAEYFLLNAFEQAGGRNVVNVMLVDFRGFDTLGEITVVCIVAITVYALLRRFRPAPESIAATGTYARLEGEEQALAAIEEPLPAGPMRMPAVLVRLLLPMAGLVSAYFLLRGHDAPGGGFVGGLVSASAIIAQYMAGGTIWVESRIRVHPLVWIGLGLLAAAAAGFVGWWDALPFLSSRGLDLELPLLGHVHLATTLLFDLGVYTLVVGATLLMLVALAHQSLRSPRRTVTPAAMDLDGDALLAQARTG
jgi:multicomponent K+:H+ antiporter subunit A